MSVKHKARKKYHNRQSLLLIALKVVRNTFIKMWLICSGGEATALAEWSPHRSEHLWVTARCHQVLHQQRRGFLPRNAKAWLGSRRIPQSNALELSHAVHRCTASPPRCAQGCDICISHGFHFQTAVRAQHASLWSVTLDSSMLNMSWDYWTRQARVAPKAGHQGAALGMRAPHSRRLKGSSQFSL